MNSANPRDRAVATRSGEGSARQVHRPGDPTPGSTGMGGGAWYGIAGYFSPTTAVHTSDRGPWHRLDPGTTQVSAPRSRPRAYAGTAKRGLDLSQIT